jgi:hypothetical protein
MKKVTVSQKGTGGSSASQNTAVHSGSRPGSGKIKTPSSAPAKSQMIRPVNKIDNS